MVNSKTIKTIRALPLITLLVLSSMYKDTFNSATYAGLGFLCLAIHTFYIVFRGEKELEARFENQWRGALFLFGLLIIFILFFIVVATNNYRLFILVPIVGILYIPYLVLIDRIFPDHKGTKSNIKFFIGQSMRLLLISISIVFLIGVTAFTLGVIIN